ncbi:hypothetical protein ACOME3_010435 [Neoechinorhynchus agilis]
MLIRTIATRMFRCNRSLINRTNGHRYIQSFRNPYRGSYISWKSVFATSLVGVPLVGYFWYLKQNYEKNRRKSIRESVGKASIGGGFSLVDQDGNRKTDNDFKGSWLMIYFGFTHCPDICPEEIEKMVDAVDGVRKADPSIKIAKIFISIDPERDTVEAVREYVRDFASDLIGLTGTEEEVTVVAKRYRVYFKASPKDYENDYIVDHSIITYLVNPDGEFVDFYGKNVSTKKLEEAILAQVSAYRKKHKE